MRAMILAAGLGTRLQPLTKLRPKPALPVRGLPIVTYLMKLLEKHGVREVMVNLHHLPNEMRRAIETHAPEGMQIQYSTEQHLLGTGGGIRRAAKFLRESDPSIILAGDMLLDTDLASLVARHRDRRDAVTLLLRDDRRAKAFGTIGVDAEDRVRRIGERFDLGGEERSGVFVSLRVMAARAFEQMPESEVFEDLRDWYAPLLEQGADDIRGEIQSEGACVWEPVGTPEEYLRVNLTPPRLSYISSEEIFRSGEAECRRGLVLGSGATLGDGVRLEQAVVWENERVPDHLVANQGVFAGGQFYEFPLDSGNER